MSTIPTENQAQQEVRTDTTEINLAKQRQMYEKKLEQERMARQQAEERAVAAERAAQERARSSPLNEEDDDDDSDPYIDKRKLNKKLAKFGEQTKQQTQQEIQMAVAQALDNERRENYIKDNPDYKKIMNDEEMLSNFALKHPRLAENILKMPESFERAKLVYETIKTVGFDRPEQKGSSVQDKVDANRRSPYYQPSAPGTAPYATGPTSKDYSESDKKNAYDKLKELKSRLRI